MAKRTKFFGFSLDKFIFYVTRPVLKRFFFIHLFFLIYIPFYRILLRLKQNMCI